jgi:hypothetical protein
MMTVSVENVVGCDVEELLKRVTSKNRLCGLVARVLGYRSGGPGSIPGTARKK